MSSMNECDVLLADEGGRTGRVVVRDLGRHGLRVRVFDDSAVASDEYGYVRGLRRCVEECSPRMIIPVFKGEWLSSHRDEILSDLPEVPSVPVDTAEKLHLLDDKVLCSQLASGLGIVQPVMYSDDGFDSIGSWPVVFKRAAGLSGSGVYFPRDRRALDNLVRSCNFSGGVKPHLVMDYIDGYDVCVDAIRWPSADPSGETFFAASAYRVILPRGKGISRLRMPVRHPELVASARKILDSIDYRGVCGFDFRIDRRSGKSYFLECNPRLSGGLSTTIAFGPDLPWLLWKLGR